jgi:hypothetical protein
MEYMGIWEAQHVGIIQGAEYVVGVIFAAALAVTLLYKAGLGISAIKRSFE